MEEMHGRLLILRRFSRRKSSTHSPRTPFRPLRTIPVAFTCVPKDA